MDVQTFMVTLQHETIGTIFKAIGTLIIGFIAAHFAARIVAALTATRPEFSSQFRFLIGKLTYYLVIFTFTLMFLHQLGLHVTFFVGLFSIGIIAIGFGGQETIANIIAGFFLIAEQSLKIDDVIKVNGTIGEIISFDLLSVKIKTLSNEILRIPNSYFILNRIANYSAFKQGYIPIPILVVFKDGTLLDSIVNRLEEFAEKFDYCDKDVMPIYTVKYQGHTVLVLQITSMIPFRAIEDAHKNLQYDLKNFLGANETLYGEDYRVLLERQQVNITVS